MKMIVKYIPLTNRVRGLYCNLWAKRSARAGKKQGSLTYSMEGENEVSKIFITGISLRLIRHAKKESSRSLAGHTVKYGPQN